ncbi:addiction module antidote protein [Methylobacterium sp. Gmos1]
MPLETVPWDVVDSLDTPERVALYLEAVLEEGDPVLLAAALGDIARAKGMAQVARETGLSRETLYRTLSDEGNPQLKTLMAVLKALGLKLAVAPVVATEAGAA